MVGAGLACSAGARSVGAGCEGASAGRGGGKGGDAAVDALEACSGKASIAVIMREAKRHLAREVIVATRLLDGVLSRIDADISRLNNLIDQPAQAAHGEFNAVARKLPRGLKNYAAAFARPSSRLVF
jgi:hypothetical protein